MSIFFRLLAVTIICGSAYACENATRATSPEAARYILNGEPDAVRHRQVGALCMMVTEGDPWTCFPGAAVLISPTVMVSVAHAGPFFASVNPARIGMSFDATPSPNSVVHEATYHAHPAWNPADIANPMDLGVFVLHEAVTDVNPARLPPINFLDQQAIDRAFYTIVGYGLSTLSGWPAQPQWGTRLSGRTAGSVLHPGSIVTTQGDAYPQTACFGDSGSALFFRDSDVLLGTYSTPLAGDCRQGLYTRLDAPAARAWLNQFLAAE